MKCQIREPRATPHQFQHFMTPSALSLAGKWRRGCQHAPAMCQLEPQPRFNQGRCHTKTALKFYKLQMKKVSEEKKKANLLNNRRSVPNILGFKTFSRSVPRSQGSVPRDLQLRGSLLGRTPTFSLEAASYARGFRLSATESGSRKPGVPHQRSQGSQALYVEQSRSPEDLGLAPGPCGSRAAPCRILQSRHLCQL